MNQNTLFEFPGDGANDCFKAIFFFGEREFLAKTVEICMFADNDFG